MSVDVEGAPAPEQRRGIYSTAIIGERLMGAMTLEALRAARAWATEERKRLDGLSLEELEREARPAIERTQREAQAYADDCRRGLVSTSAQAEAFERLQREVALSRRIAAGEGTPDELAALELERDCLQIEGNRGWKRWRDVHALRGAMRR